MFDPNVEKGSFEGYINNARLKAREKSKPTRSTDT